MSSYMPQPSNPTFRKNGETWGTPDDESSVTPFERGPWNPTLAQQTRKDGAPIVLRRVKSRKAKAPYIIHSASTSTITCVRGIFCCAA